MAGEHATKEKYGRIVTVTLIGARDVDCITMSLELTQHAGGRIMTAGFLLMNAGV
jgi:hypothetical protein